jgi:hypothetical protein
VNRTEKIHIEVKHEAYCCCMRLEEKGKKKIDDENCKQRNAAVQ